MGRRGYRGNLVAPREDERMSIGDSHVSEACDALNKTAKATAALMTTYTPTFHGTLPMIFKDADLEALQRVRGMVNTTTNIKGYEVFTGVKLFMHFEDNKSKVPAIEERMLHLQHDRMAPLLAHIATVKAVHERFEEVKAVLRWLNRNATPGAIRYFFPPALKLCPKSPALTELQHVPSRYTTPVHIGDWGQSIKDAAATVAQSAMLPNDAVERPKAVMWLEFATREVHLTLDTHYSTDVMLYHI